jgi:hypothetical protein
MHGLDITVAFGLALLCATLGIVQRLVVGLLQRLGLSGRLTVTFEYCVH